VLASAQFAVLAGAFDFVCGRFAPTGMAHASFAGFVGATFLQLQRFAACLALWKRGKFPQLPQSLYSHAFGGR
jgi:hypothetical protein